MSNLTLSKPWTLWPQPKGWSTLFYEICCFFPQNVCIQNELHSVFCVHCIVYGSFYNYKLKIWTRRCQKNFLLHCYKNRNISSTKARIFMKIQTYVHEIPVSTKKCFWRCMHTLTCTLRRMRKCVHSRSNHAKTPGKSKLVLSMA